MGIVWRQFSISRFGSALLQAFGALWLVIQVTTFFSQSWADTIKSGWWVFLIGGLAIGGYSAWPRSRVKARISGTDVEVEVRACDIFVLEGALIVGSNTTFDTTLEDKTISPASVQGQFTTRFCSSIPELDRQIQAALQDIPPAKRRSTEDKSYGKVNEYDFGTVASIEIGGKRAYFAAIAWLNAHRVANSDRESFLDALPRIWTEIRSRGGIEPLCCPILGSGFSRLNLTREELIREIIKSFVAATLEAKFCEKLTVAVHPKDFQTGHIDLQRIGRFLEHECVYAGTGSTPDHSGPVGTPLSS